MTKNIKRGHTIETVALGAEFILSDDISVVCGLFCLRPSTFRDRKNRGADCAFRQNFYTDFSSRAIGNINLEKHFLNFIADAMN